MVLQLGSKELTFIDIVGEQRIRGSLLGLAFVIVASSSTIVSFIVDESIVIVVGQAIMGSLVDLACLLRSSILGAIVEYPFPLGLFIPLVLAFALLLGVLFVSMVSFRIHLSFVFSSCEVLVESRISIGLG